MASSHCTRRLFFLSSFKSFLRPNNHSPASIMPPRRFSPFLRTIVYQLGSVESLLPLHSIVATARMVSFLSIDSRNCQAFSQVTLSCNHPGP
ncbi:protein NONRESPONDING TO OXYLIPINS 2, mitochondrial-like [Cicer arietinum]|uniref:Uncharacterized protein LOC101499745 n=1 Tax=Cicer arietinum TaxID=3827 RepID=A0A1S2YUF2_CICAR|nr:uncharacterized protein LOC101499745 [Cicer arietinum]XP_004510104.1 uncharacterized protein LOC101499745 [Cicer arietinum]